MGHAKPSAWEGEAKYLGRDRDSSLLSSSAHSWTLHFHAKISNICHDLASDNMSLPPRTVLWGQETGTPVKWKLTFRHETAQPMAVTSH